MLKDKGEKSQQNMFQDEIIGFSHVKDQLSKPP